MHPRNSPAHLTALLLLLVTPAAAQAAETVVMENGDRLTGHLVHMNDGVLELETGYAGSVKANWAQVREICSEGTIGVRLNGDEVVVVRSLKKEAGALLLDSRREALANVTQLNPADWELGHAAKINGELDVALKLDRGNTHDDLSDLRGRIEWKKRQHRIRLGGEFQYSQSGNEVAADNWSAETAYDNKASKQFYFGERSSFRSDRMTNLILRWTIGPYAGMRLIETSRTRLNAETGFEYASDNYRFKPVDSFLAESWRMELSHFIIPEKLEIYHRNRGLASLTSGAGISIDTWTGLKFPVASGMYTSAEVKTTFNSDAPPETTAWDTSYRFKIGYMW